MTELQRLKLELKDERKKNKLLIEVYRDLFEKLNSIENRLKEMIENE